MAADHIQYLQAMLDENERTQATFPNGDWWQGECDALRAAIDALRAEAGAVGDGMDARDESELLRLRFAMGERLKLAELVEAASDYLRHYLRDEADDEIGPDGKGHWTGVDVPQQTMIHRLRDALAQARRTDRE